MKTDFYFNCAAHRAKLIKQEVSGDNNPNEKRLVVSEKPYKCDLCDFCAVRAAIVKVHRKIHSGETPSKRGVGDYVSAQQLGNIKGEKPYKCDLCSFGTIHSSIFKMHKRIHITENNYIQDITYLILQFITMYSNVQ